LSWNIEAGDVTGVGSWCIFSLANIIIKELSLELKARSRAISDDALLETEE
jgi:hypothetical protein